MENIQICCGRKSSVPPLSSSSSSEYSWLVSYGSEFKEDTDHIFFSATRSPDFHQNQHYHCRIPELGGREILGCFYGWLLLYRYPPPDLSLLEFCLWNPITLKFIHLPRLKLELKPKSLGDNGGNDDANQADEDDILCCCLSSSPSDQNSVVLLSRASKPSIVVCLLRSKRKLWTEISYANQINNLYNYDNDLIRSLACCNDKVYAFTCQQRFIQVDILINQARNVVINLLPFGMLPDCRLHSSTTYLTGYCKELFTIIECFRFDKLQSIKLFKLDFSTMKWEELKRAKDGVFFLVGGHYSQISCRAIESESGTYIHGIWDSCNVYSYNLEDKTISLSSLHCQDLSPELWRPCYISPWVMPESRLVDDHVEAKCKSETEEEQGKEEEELVVRSVTSSEVDRMMNEQLGEKLIATTDQGSLLNIPLHILDLIVEDLIAVDYLNFRATCKHFRLAAPPIQWSSATALGRLQTRTPWLMVLDEHQGITTFTDPKFGDKYFMTTFFELIGHAVICASKYGWLLIFKGNFICPFFFNPFTKVTIRLPELELSLSRYSNFAFSEPPTSPSCIVAALIDYIETVHLTFPGESVWLAINIHHDIPYNLSTHNSPIFHGENLYILCQDGQLGILRLDQNLTSEILVVEPTFVTSRAQRFFLVECGNDLLSIIMGEVGEWVEIFKLNHSTLQWEWEKVYDIGKHMIFVCDTSCFSVVAKIPGMENKIYFPRFRGGSIIFYSLDTCKFHTFGGKGEDKGETLKDFFPAKEQLMCVWIEPSCSS